MAVRENTGLQVALILFVLITVGLAIATVSYHYKSNRLAEEAVAANNKARTSDAARDKALMENQQLKQWIGWAPDAAIAEIEQGYNDDMLMYGTNFDDDARNYRKLAGYLIGEVRKPSQQVVHSANPEKNEIALKTQAVAREVAEKQTVIDARTALVTEFDGQRSKFAEYQKTITGQKDQLVTQLDATRGQIDQVKAKADRDVTAVSQQLAKAENLIQGFQRARSESSPEETQRADGSVSWVNQQASMVWLDLGSADGLRRGQTFSVYPESESTFDKNNVKATVEVTRVVSEHVSEARITSDTLSDPILPKDKIHSPTFYPGRKVKFALVGFLDADGDGTSDRTMVRNLIATNGGEIVAEVDDAGKQTGTLEVDTRFLVIGARPDERSGPAAIQGYSRMVGEAQRFGIKQITLDQLLTDMGYRAEATTQTLGRGASGSDFRARPDEGVNRQSTGNVSRFRERTPPAGGNAFP